MKKLIFAFLIIFAATNVFSQEQGLHLFLGGNGSRTNFSYKLDGGNPKPDWGYGAFIGAQYYFNQHLGLSLGVDFSVFNTQSQFTKKEDRDKNPKFAFDEMRDQDGDLFDYTIWLYGKDGNSYGWSEKQKTYFIDIPLLMKFQTKWGKKEIFGLYIGMGIKLQVPISSTYKAEGNVRANAYYKEKELTLGDSIPLPWHGLGTADKNLEGKNQLKIGCAIHGEAGFLIGLGRRVDLMLGVSADYGFLNIKKNSDPLVVVKDKVLYDGQVGDVATYNGILNSNKTNMIHPLSIKGNLGLRIKIGKLKEKSENQDETAKQLAEILSNMEKGTGRRDTIIVNPVPVSVYLPSPDENNREGAGGRGQWQPVDNGSGSGRGTTQRRGAPLPQSVIDEIEESIYFPLNKYTLDQEAIEVLDRKVAQMKRYPYATVSVVGHTCDLGSGGLNDELSLNRATAARLYMISKGIRPSRIELIPMGKNYPTHPNTTEDSRRLNRRVDFIFND